MREYFNINAYIPREYDMPNAYFLHEYIDFHADKLVAAFKSNQILIYLEP